MLSSVFRPNSGISRSSSWFHNILFVFCPKRIRWVLIFREGSKSCPALRPQSISAQCADSSGPYVRHLDRRNMFTTIDGRLFSTLRCSHVSLMKQNVVNTYIRITSVHRNMSETARNKEHDCHNRFITTYLPHMYIPRPEYTKANVYRKWHTYILNVEISVTAFCIHTTLVPNISSTAEYCKLKANLYVRLTLYVHKC